jgi:hypothetical protein
VVLLGAGVSSKAVVTIGETINQADLSKELKEAMVALTSTTVKRSWFINFPKSNPKIT